MNKNELIEFIKNHVADDLKVTKELTEPPDHFDLPDVRTGAIYPPVPFKHKTVKGREKIVLKIEGYYND